MKTFTVAAFTALVSSGALAVPMAGHHDHKAPAHAHLHLHKKRDVVWRTEWEVFTTIVWKTVYADGTTPTQAAGLAHTSVVAHTSVAAPVPSSPSETGASPPPPPAYTTSATSSQAPTPPPAPTTSAYVAPSAPTTQAPAPTSTPEAAPSPSPAPSSYSPEPAPAPAPSSAAPAPAPAPSTSYGGGADASDVMSTESGAAHTGDATFWDPGLGSCGFNNADGEDVVAISQDVYDQHTIAGNPNNNPLCGRTVNIKCSDGNTIPAKVVDRCTGCKPGDLDMTRTLFAKVNPQGDGRVKGMQWSWS